MWIEVDEKVSAFIKKKFPVDLSVEPPQHIILNLIKIHYVDREDVEALISLFHRVVATGGSFSLSGIRLMVKEILGNQFFMNVPSDDGGLDDGGSVGVPARPRHPNPSDSFEASFDENNN